MWNEAKLVAFSLQIEVKLFKGRSTTTRKRTRFHDEHTPDENVNEMNEADESPEEAHFRKHIFYVVLDNVIGGQFGGQFVSVQQNKFLTPSAFVGTTRRCQKRN